jgi:two-component sensor histidine kinase/ligand-binding sensor domain-containing protein
MAKAVVPKLSLRYLILFLLLSLSFCAVAFQYNFKNYTVADGLASSGVNHIFQDSRGYVWFATQGGGVSRFNGLAFKNFNKSDGLVSNDVTYITEDKNNNIWIATASGVSKFDGAKFTNYGEREGLKGVVYAVCIDAENRVWVALQEGGIRMFDKDTFRTISQLAPLLEAFTVATDKSNQLWFGLGNGIASFANGKLTQHSMVKEVGDKTFFSSFTDNAGNVWMGSTSGEVVIIRPDKTFRKLDLPDDIRNDFIGSITQDHKGNMWFATDHGLLKYNGKEFKLLGEQEGLSVNSAQAVMADYEDNIWVGTLGGGVNLLSSEAFVRFTEKDGLSSRNVTAVCSTPNGETYYVGTSDGLFVRNKSTDAAFKKIGSIKQIDGVNISSVLVDAKGQIWVSTQEGIFVIEKAESSFRLLKQYNQVQGERIISPLKILHDSKGNTWIATYGSGLVFISPKTSRIYNTKSGFVSDKVLTVYEDKQSNIWVGTQDAGLLKFDGNTFISITDNGRKADKSVWCITGDEKGNIFFGTGELGIGRFDGKRLYSYTTTDGLQSESIQSIIWDKTQNCLWVGSEKGLDKITFKNNYSVLQIKHYITNDGFGSMAINHNGLHMSNSGALWLGTVNGLWSYNPQSDKKQSTPPKIQLSGIRLFYQTVKWNDFSDSVVSHTGLPINLELEYNKNHLTFDIQALTTADVSYTFILEGQDEEWSQPDKNNRITYTNINPGSSYTFKAKAINAQGAESEQTISFSFYIKPPWWSTWWFRFVVVFAAIAAVIAVVKRREQVLKERNVELEKTVTLRTQEIAQQKTLVEKTLVEKEGLLHEKEVLLKEIHHRVKNNLQTISSMLMLQSAGLKDTEAKKAITESQSRVRSIALVHQKLYQTDGLEKVELNAFVKDLTVQIQSLYREQSKDISIHLSIPETQLLIDKAIPLGLILNELITNSFKYAFADNKGQIEIIFVSDQLEPSPVPRFSGVLTYRDTGPGLQSPDLLNNASTLGLRLIKLLSQQIGAALSYSNDNGSEFVFTFTRSA